MKVWNWVFYIKGRKWDESGEKNCLEEEKGKAEIVGGKKLPE